MNKLNVIKFSATWCMPCKFFSPTFHKVMEKFKENINVKELDVEDDESLDYVEKFQIKNLPTVIITDESNNEIGRIVGNISEQSLMQFITDATKTKQLNGEQ